MLHIYILCYCINPHLGCHVSTLPKIIPHDLEPVIYFVSKTEIIFIREEINDLCITLVQISENSPTRAGSYYKQLSDLKLILVYEMQSAQFLKCL